MMRALANTHFMASFLRMLLLCFAFVLVGNMAIPTPAYAQTAQETAQPNACSKYKGLINRFGSCIKETVMKVAIKYFVSFYALFLTAIKATLTLGIIVYGVMLASGMVENVKRDTMILLLKIVFVVFFAQNLELLYFWVINMMDGLIGLFFQFSSSMDEGKCSIISGGFGPFNRLDCLMDLVVGIKTSAYDGSASGKITGDGLERGLINFFYKSGISGSIGLFIGFLGMAIIYTLLFTIVKIVFMYLMAIIGITFIMMLGPMFIPLVIFKQTKQYFDKWVMLIVSFGLQPVIMFAYVACMIIALDKAIFSGSNSLMSAIYGPAAQPNNFAVNQGLKTSDASFGIQAKVDDSLKNVNGLLPVDKLGSMPGTMVRDQSGGAGADNGKVFAQHLPLRQIDWKQIAADRGIEEKDLMKQVMNAMIFVALISYVFFAMLNHIPSLGYDLATAATYEGANLYDAVGKNPIAGAGQGLAGGVKGGIEKLLGGGAR